MPPVISKPVFHPNCTLEFDVQISDERTTILHFTYRSGGRIRIWDSTFLVQQNRRRKKLLYAFNIAQYPTWTSVGKNYRFTLIFEGLDKDCASFDLFEEIPEPGGFKVCNIRRNRSDVYQIVI